MIPSKPSGNRRECVARPGRQNVTTDRRPRRFLVATLSLVGAVLAGCAGEPATAAASIPSPMPPVAATAPAPSPVQDLARMDSQGAVEFVVSPRSWTRETAGTIEFEISMDTHSVDLSMDLAELSTLQTDLGVSVAALDWSGGSGHHVVGVLRFPAVGSTGPAVLEGAGLLILTIRDVDAPTRVFQWEVASLP